MPAASSERYIFSIKDEPGQHGSTSVTIQENWIRLLSPTGKARAGGQSGQEICKSFSCTLRKCSWLRLFRCSILGGSRNVSTVFSFGGCDLLSIRGQASANTATATAPPQQILPPIRHPQSANDFDSGMLIPCRLAGNRVFDKLAQSDASKKKRALNRAAPGTPAKGHIETATGQRPLRGAAQVTAFDVQEPRLRLAVFQEAVLDAHASFKLSMPAVFGWRHGGSPDRRGMRYHLISVDSTMANRREQSPI